MNKNKISKFQSASNTMQNIGLVINLLIFSAITVLNYFLLPTIVDGWTFLLLGWFILGFVVVGFLGGVVDFFRAIFACSKLKFIYILLSIAIMAINGYFFWQVIQVV